MGFAFVRSATLVGIDALPIEVEVDISGGLPRFHVVGLPDAATSEARERVRSAIKNSGFPFPRTVITVNLSPASLKKHGAAYDLPIALGILGASGEIPTDRFRELLVLGELALDGSVRATGGILPCATLAKKLGCTGIIVPAHNSEEAALVHSISIHPITDLTRLINALRSSGELPKAVPQSHITQKEKRCAVDFKDIAGQSHAKRALEIAAAGGHNVLFIGSPGSGKTLLARSLPGILPPPSFDEALEMTAIHSVHGSLPKDEVLLRERPFRSPHHSASGVALVGGGGNPKPGEITLAHRGVLFLDEFPEFPRHALEELREPLEEGRITISRAMGSVTFPARFMLVAAMNPCPCGYAFDRERPCTCSPLSRERYRQKISGPLLDRIDLIVEVPRLPITAFGDAERESSACVGTRVERARDLARVRYESTHITTNAELSPSDLKVHCALPREDATFFQETAEAFKLSARAYTRMLKVARTIADLNEKPAIERGHLMEALRFRSSLTEDNRTDS